MKEERINGVLINANGLINHRIERIEADFTDYTASCGIRHSQAFALIKALRIAVKGMNERSLTPTFQEDTGRNFEEEIIEALK